MAETPKKERRAYFTPSEGEALVEDWRRSGVGAGEYCRTRGVTRSRLDYWTRKVARSDFVEVVVEPDDREPAGTAEAVEDVIEIVVGDVFVRIPARPGMAQEVLSALSKGAP